MRILAASKPLELEQLAMMDHNLKWFKEVIEEPIRARNAGGGSRIIGTTIVERWTYSRAQGQFPALLHVEEGRVKRIEFLTRN